MRLFIALLVLLLPAFVQAKKPPQAPPLTDEASAWVVTERADPPCDVPGCKCGCTEGGVCTCTSKSVKKWRAIGMLGANGATLWFVSNRDYPVPSDSPHYATFELANQEAARRNVSKVVKKYVDGQRIGNATYYAEDNSWYADAEPEPPPLRDYGQPWAAQQQFFAPPPPMMSFGGGGFRGGRSGGC